jgi:hypothetical protein
VVFSSSIGSAGSVDSMFTTPHDDRGSVKDPSSGMKSSLFSVILSSHPTHLSARELVSISRYCGELRKKGFRKLKKLEKTKSYFRAKAIIEVGSSVRTTVRGSLKI